MFLDIVEWIQQAHRLRSPKGRKNAIKMDLNENVDVFEETMLQDFLKTIHSFDIHCYPEYDALLEKLSLYTGQNSKRILLCNGSDRGIELLLRLLFQSGMEVVLPSPIFQSFSQNLQILNVKTLTPLYTYSSTTGFEFPLQETLEKLKTANGLILCNPNNPLGSILPEDIFLQLLNVCYERKIPCVVDEAYFEFEDKTFLPFIEKYPNLFIIRTFSKMFGLAGLRLGYVCSQEENIEQLLKIRPIRDVNHIAVRAGEYVLDHLKYFEEKKKLQKSIQFELTQFLKAHDVEILSQGGNFFLLRDNNAQKMESFFAENNIRIKDLSFYPLSDNLLKNTLRISVPAQEYYKKEFQEAWLSYKKK